MTRWRHRSPHRFTAACPTPRSRSSPTAPTRRSSRSRRPTSPCCGASSIATAADAPLLPDPTRSCWTLQQWLTLGGAEDDRGRKDGVEDDSGKLSLRRGALALRRPDSRCHHLQLHDLPPLRRALGVWL